MMHILRYIPLTIALGIVVSACSDPETDTPSLYDSPETYITFAHPGINLTATVGDFATSSPSRSAIVTSSSEIESFKVWGFCVPNNISGGQSESSASLDWNRKSKFFTTGSDVKLNGNGKTDNSVVATLAAGSTTYNGGTLAKWYDNAAAQYSFIAVCDNSAADYTEYSMGNADATSGKEHGPQLKVTLPVSGNVTDHNAIPDIMIAATFDHNASDGRVPLSFFHIMTGIRFKFVNHTDKELRINSVTYSGNFYREATFDLTTDSPVMTVNTTNTYTGNYTL
ncbi:MAG: fimbrillin family protein, partial [Duncaniella sp.]|nr:fimbrillin family protein [Duncaniella sp.]